MPPSTPPISGATQNSQSWASAHPPTNSAGPVLRAGFTEVFVIGMPTRWIRVSPKPIASGANPTGALPCVAPMMMKEHHRQDDLGEQAREQAILARRVLAVAVGGKALREIKLGRPACDGVEDGGGYHRADDLGHDVGRDILGWETPARSKADCDSRIEVAA